MTFLIDGYNLMHAIGFLRQGLPTGGLLRARKRFLDWLAVEMKGRPDTVRVVFDAQEAPAKSPEIDYEGIRVVFAHQQTADDRIEELLIAEPQPNRLTVVSNDTRLQMAGRRRGAGVFTCQQFVDLLLEEQKKAPPQPVVDDKPVPAAGMDEMAEWLNVFSTPKRKKR